MNSRLQNTDYYLGLDCGTSSVGFAVTDTDYNILKFNGKAMWGSHLFEEAQTAKERRGIRCSRRGRQRRARRLKLLQEIFAEEIYRKDPVFFIRLNNSKYLVQDKNCPDKNILFNDPEFKDKDFFKLFPTPYHLRSELINKGTDDIRFLYLALHHIIKHRGHFLFPGENMAAISSIEPLVDDLKESFELSFSSDIKISSVEDLEEALKCKRRTDKSEKLSNVISTEDQKLTNLIVKILLGYKVKTEVLFNNDDYSQCAGIEFKKVSFEDENLPVLEETLNDDEFKLIRTLKGIYDWALLVDVMKGYPYISEAKKSLFENNKQDLKLLKAVIKKYVPDEYDSFFHSAKEGAFPSYIGKNHDKSQTKSFRIKRISVDVFYKEVSSILKKCNQNDPYIIKLLSSIEDSSFMPLLSSYRNGVIPYQVNKIELDAILNNAKSRFAFLTIPDDEGYTPVDKIKALLTFRIPYYVGPLGKNNKAESVYSWMERRESGRILPWNFNKKVNTEASAEKFITRMTNKCTYCKEEDVLPKNSLAYSKYLVLNELNNLRVKNLRLPVPVKQEIYENLFKERKKVTIKSVVQYLIKEGYFSKSELSTEDISGLESDFKSSLGTYIDFKPYMNKGKLKADDVDLIVKWITIFPEGGEILENRLHNHFGQMLSDDEIKHICKLKYVGWGRFSHKFLYELQSINHETGQQMSLISMMWNTQLNLMELMGSNYEFKAQITTPAVIRKLDYTVVDDLYVSPSVKRQIWQTLRIVNEITRIMKHPPKKVFIETTRGSQEKKRSVSRRTDLIEKLKNAIKSNSSYNQEFKALLTNLEAKTESQISIQDKLYLYFTQCGRCMYSNEPINLDDLYTTEIYDVDHIFPYSKSNDNSLKNKVLVLHNENALKGDSFPISDTVRKRMEPFWRMLKDKGFIPREKYDRLTKSTPLSDLELQGFINRQLVETSQSTKALAEILKAFLGDKTKIVYSKAGNVSKFRDEFEIVKCRSMNDLHHAKDAYLNIVVGNVFDTKYTSEFYRFMDGRGYGNLSTPFKYNVDGAWLAGETGTIEKIRKTLRKNNILFTKQSLERHGKLFKTQLVKKGSTKGALPAKTTDPKLVKLIESGIPVVEAYEQWNNKYGGYSSLYIAYFALVSHVVRKKNYVSFVPVSMIDARRLSKKENLIDYCISVLNYSNVQIIHPRLLINSVVEIDGYRFLITGKSSGGNVITLSSCVPLILSDTSQQTLKKIESFTRKLSENKNLIVDPIYDKINEDNTLHLFEELVEKSTQPIYRKRPENQIKLLDSEEALNSFKSLSLNDKCSVITELMKYFAMNSGRANLVLIGGTKACGTLTKGSSIDIGKTRLSIIHQSITGLFEQRIVIS